MFALPLIPYYMNNLDGDPSSFLSYFNKKKHHTSYPTNEDAKLPDFFRRSCFSSFATKSERETQGSKIISSRYEFECHNPYDYGKLLTKHNKKEDE